MEVVPHLRTDRFNQLEAGELFIFMERDISCIAIKTASGRAGDPGGLIPLGPEFPYEADESLLMAWQPSTVISFGKEFSVVLPTNPKSWHPTANTRAPVCLALSTDGPRICANGGPAPQRYFPCYVDPDTGVIFENRPPIIAYTYDWEITVPGPDGKSRSVIKFSNPI